MEVTATTLGVEVASVHGARESSAAEPSKSVADLTTAAVMSYVRFLGFFASFEQTVVQIVA